MNAQISTHLATQLPMLEGLSKLFHPYLETALHDLQTGKVVAIYNNVSKRKVGDQSAISKFVGENIEEFPDVFEPYYKVNWDGKKLKCISITLRDEFGKPIGLMCFNFDTTIFGQIATNFTKLLAVKDEDTLNPVEKFTKDWQGRVQECIDNYLKENHVTLKALSKEQKQAVVTRLYKHGLFHYRRAAEYASEQLHVSRATIYNYLKKI